MTASFCVSSQATSIMQELNPGPFAAMILNHTGWVIYSVLHTDWFIFVMETVGLLCGIWLTLSLYPLANLKVCPPTASDVCAAVSAA